MAERKRCLSRKIINIKCTFKYTDGTEAAIAFGGIALKNKKSLAELQKLYQEMPTERNAYEIDGVQYTVVSHFTGNKDIDQVMRRLAEKRAYADMRKQSAS